MKRQAGRIVMSADEVVKRLRKSGSQKTIDGMARYGIPSTRAFGVPMGAMLKLAKEVGKDHALAKALWTTGWYEARMMSSLVGEPEKVTAAEMTAWAADFDSWAICDTVCFKLWDQSPLAWKMAPKWAASKAEFVKRTGFVLMACLSHHDKHAADKDFLAFLPLIEKGASDDRNFVKKGVSWALRGIGGRSAALNKAAVILAKRLAASPEDAACWIGKDVLKQLSARASRGQ
ncbi:MAG: hypothetical protein JWO30_3076 [Fibrobacteres bacterium]|nr:hypothetical protein [Fibrobacterota bacterium]